MGCCHSSDSYHKPPKSKSPQKTLKKSSSILTPPEMTELPHRDSEKKIEEFINRLKQMEVTVEDLILKIKKIVEIVGQKMDKTEINVGLFRRVTYCLNYLGSEPDHGTGGSSAQRSKYSNYMIHANLTDLIQVLLLTDLIYHPGKPPKFGETAIEKEAREYQDDKKRWISAEMLKEIQIKSSTVSQNKHMIQILGIMLKVIEDDLGISDKEEVQIGKAAAMPHIEKILNS